MTNNFLKNKSQIVRDFSATALCFIIIMLATKLFDFISFNVLLKSLLHSLVTSSFIVLLTFVIYIFISLFSKKTANIFSSILFGTIILSESTLSFYTQESGQLMGAELFIRPLEETTQTVLASISIISVLLLIVVIIGGFSLLSHFVRKKTKGKTSSIIIIILALLSIPSTFFIDNILDNNIEARNDEASKTWYMVLTTLTLENTDVDTDIAFNETLIDEFLSENPEHIVPDKYYPLERVDNTPDVLGQYFEDIDVRPDIVFILVESLGSEVMGNNGFAPFIDSLANKSLYWKNCLSTTTRSYGAVPAITSSTIGPKGFQFGVMPQHNSLFSILESNDYQTNAFYGGDFNFDCISEYLIAQDIDYMSDFYEEFTSGNDKNLGNWWGYFDHVMFEKSIEKIKDINVPMFNLLITITNHEALDIKDEKKEKEYLEKADNIISAMNPDKADAFSKNKMRFCSMLYTDDCIRDFITDYKKMPNYENTIFVITGDHASGLIINNKLSFHTVPLIVWSPMLKESHVFNSIVTHNDIAPSINALLRDKYHLDTPQYVHWISDGLDTSSQMNFNKKMLHVNYERQMREIIYDDYIYWTKNKWESELVNKIDENLNIEIVYDDSLKSALNKKLELYKYICRYTYHNNKLTKNPINKNDYKVIHKLHNNKKIVCSTPNKKPSEIGAKHFELFEDVLVENISKAKINLDASIFINDSLWQDKYMDLVFECKEIESGESTYYTDKITKFITADIIRDEEWYELSVSKEFILNKGKRYYISVYVSSVIYDDQWVAGSKLSVGEWDAEISAPNS